MSSSINLRKINAVLDLDQLVLAARGPETMQNDLTLHLFNSRNFLILANNSEFWAFTCLFLYTIVTIAIKSETLKAQARYEFIKITYIVLNELNTDSESLRSRKGKKSPHIDVKFTENISYWRTMNILIPLLMH